MQATPSIDTLDEATWAGGTDKTAGVFKGDDVKTIMWKNGAVLQYKEPGQAESEPWSELVKEPESGKWDIPYGWKGYVTGGLIRVIPRR